MNSSVLTCLAHDNPIVVTGMGCLLAAGGGRREPERARTPGVSQPGECIRFQFFAGPLVGDDEAVFGL